MLDPTTLYWIDLYKSESVQLLNLKSPIFTPSGVYHVDKRYRKQRHAKHIYTIVFANTNYINCDRHQEFKTEDGEYIKVGRIREGMKLMTFDGTIPVAYILCVKTSMSLIQIIPDSPYHEFFIGESKIITRDLYE